MFDDILPSKSAAPCALVAAAAESWRQAPVTKGRRQCFSNLSGKVGRKQKTTTTNKTNEERKKKKSPTNPQAVVVYF